MSLKVTQPQQPVVSPSTPSPAAPRAPATPAASEPICAHVHDEFAHREEPSVDAGAALGSEVPSAPEGAKAEAAPDKTVIDVYFHVINQGKGVKNGDLPASAINAQIDVLNQAYADAGFEFNLVKVDRTTNKAWYTAQPGTDAEAQMKRSLRAGDQGDLNIYATSPSENLLGWATFPSDFEDAPKMDGVVVLNNSLPGLNEQFLGHTATHEVGHWLGLHHTFNQPSRPNNDGISDTPEHEVNFGRPPEGTDTLPKKPGLDPIHNYMNYVDDAWMTEFTPGQIQRMQEQFDRYRDETPGVMDRTTRAA